jgi:hypothetical protein
MDCATHLPFSLIRGEERGIRALIIHLTLHALIAYMDLMIVLAPTDVLHRNFAKYIFKNGEFQKIFMNICDHILRKPTVFLCHRYVFPF